MVEKLKTIVTGNGDFEKLISLDGLYVDKTKFLLDLISTRGGESFFFFNRPRRFGKSLTISTLKAIFEGKKELFKGLYIYDKYDFPQYPVLSFSMSSIKSTSADFMKYDLCDLIFSQAEMLGVLDLLQHYTEIKEPYFIFRKLIEAVY